jgi:hypothetical protein
MGYKDLVENNVRWQAVVDIGMKLRPSETLSSEPHLGLVVKPITLAHLCFSKVQPNFL